MHQLFKFGILIGVIAVLGALQLLQAPATVKLEDNQFGLEILHLPVGREEEAQERISVE